MREFPAIVNVSSDRVYVFAHEKVSARWVLRLAMVENKRIRMNVAQEYVEKFKGSNRASAKTDD